MAVEGQGAEEKSSILRFQTSDLRFQISDFREVLRMKVSMPI